MTYTIRQVATQFHMQPSTLRYYEEQGLLTIAISTVCVRSAASRTLA